jgi:hypothetical protein
MMAGARCVGCASDPVNPSRLDSSCAVASPEWDGGVPYDDIPLHTLVHNPEHEPGIYFGHYAYETIHEHASGPATNYRGKEMWVYNLNDGWGYMPKDTPYWHLASTCSEPHKYFRKEV